MVNKDALTRIGARSLQEFSKKPDFNNCPPPHTVLSNEHAHHTIGIRFEKIKFYAIHLSSLVQQGTTSLALMLVRAEASPTTGATLAPLGTTAVRLVISCCQ